VRPVAAPADKRFRRAHVKPTRRRRWRAGLATAAKYAVVTSVSIAALYRGGSVAAHARALQIDRIVVKGNSRLSTGDVLTLVNGLRGENLVWTDLESWRRLLLTSPWVKDAALRRSLPSTVEVFVSERRPMAVGRVGGKLYLIDESGLVIADYSARYADLDLPIVDGLSGGERGEEDADEMRAALAGRIIAAVGSRPEIAKRLSQIDVSDLHNATVILSGDPAVLYVGEDRFLARLESYQDLASALQERVPDIDYVDLRFDDRIYVRPVGKSGKTASVALAH